MSQSPDALAGVVARVREAIAGASWAEQLDDVPRSVVINKSDALTILAALAEARKDSERINWLQENPNDLFYIKERGGWSYGYELGHRPYIRDAIDSARTPQPETPE